MSKVFQIKSSPGSSIDAFFSSDRHNSVQRIASSKIRIASEDSLSGFMRISSNTLVRISQKDFWRLGEDEDGVYIEKLVDDDSGPVQG